MPKNIIIIGAGGHAKVIADIIIKNNDNLVGYLDDNKKDDKLIGFPILGSLNDINKYIDKVEFVIGIGDNYIRRDISQKYNAQWYTAIHPNSTLSIDASLGEGSVIMANAIINTSARVGKHCIINTGSIIEHDNNIQDYSHVSPNSTLCGNVKIGRLTHIGAGATIKNNISICAEVVVGAGAVVVKNILEKGIYVGVPSKKIRD